jgi:CRISPR-associated protein Csb2
MRPTVARFAVMSQKLPHLTETIILAERVHAALVSLSGGSPVFTGYNEQGKPVEGHGHAHVFCESNLGLGKATGGEITHITIYASMGFSSVDKQALEDLREIWGGDDPVVHLLLQGLGRREDFGGLDPERGQSPLLAKSRTWVSRTPFLPTRHHKVTRAGVPKVDATGLQIGSSEHDLLRLLDLSGLPAPEAVESVPCTSLGGRETPWASFACRRSNGEGRRSAYGIGYGFRIEFAEPVQGPVAVGYASHFGMGGFETVEKFDMRVAENG